jgi:glycosyltransferase involved in cell wall biosynthesis
MTHLVPDTPDVSVIVRAHASHDIACAIDSVFAQTVSGFEVIVVNESSPETPDLRAAPSRHTSRIRHIELPRNRGAAVARNAGIVAARGRYLAFLDADDRWYPEFLDRQVAYLDNHPQCALVYADVRIIGESPLAGYRFMERAPSNGAVTLLSLVEQRCNVILSTVVARRQVILGAGMFDEGLRRGQEFDLWLRLALKGASLDYQPMVLAARRVRRDGLSEGAVAELERVLNVLDRFGRRHQLDAQTRTALRVRTMRLVDRLEIEQAKQRILEGNFAAAQYHLAATRERSLQMRVAILAMRIAPRLVRAVYTRAFSDRSVPAVAASAR